MRFFEGPYKGPSSKSLSGQRDQQGDLRGLGVCTLDCFHTLAGAQTEEAPLAGLALTGQGLSSQGAMVGGTSRAEVGGGLKNWGIVWHPGVLSPTWADIGEFLGLLKAQKQVRKARKQDP